MKNSIYLIFTLAFLFFSQFANAQDFVWAKQMGGTSLESGNSITLDASGNIYTTGSFIGTVDFDPGVGIFNLTSKVGSFDIFISKIDAAGNFVWANKIGGNGIDYSSSIVLDAAGNIYTTGYFEKTTDFDPSSAFVNLTAVGVRDIFISKLNSAGNFVWAKQLGGIGIEIGYSISLDASGNVYTTGFFSGTVDFDPGSGVFNLDTVGGDDLFISKLDSSGNFVWAKTIGGIGKELGSFISLDSFGNIFITGDFENTVDFDPSAGIFNLTSSGDRDIFILKLDALGNLVWVKQMGATDSDRGRSLSIDAFGNVYTTGSFSETVDFDPSAGTFNLTSAGGFDIFISKLDNAGNFVWAKKMGGTNSDQSTSIMLDNIGNIYTTGGFRGTADFDPSAGTFNFTSLGSIDIFISKLDATGNFVWAKQLGGVSEDNGFSISLDASANVYTTGSFRETVDFDPGLGVFNLISEGLNDIFISKLSNGTSGIAGNSSNSDINIYPNPTKNQINFSVETNVQLTNITGQLIVEKNNVSMLDLSEHAAGLYFITLLDKKGKVIQRSKIVKE